MSKKQKIVKEILRGVDDVENERYAEDDAPFVIVDDAAQSEPVPETLPYEPVLTDAPFPLPVETITTGPRALYRNVPGTNVTRAAAVAYARKNWPHGGLGKPPTVGIAWIENSVRHAMSWAALALEP